MKGKSVAETKSNNRWKLGLHPFLVWPQSMTRVQVIWCWGNWCKGGCIFLVRMQKPFQKFISSAAGHTRANFEIYPNLVYSKYQHFFCVLFLPQLNWCIGTYLKFKFNPGCYRLRRYLQSWATLEIRRERRQCFPIIELRGYVDKSESDV